MKTRSLLFFIFALFFVFFCTANAQEAPIVVTLNVDTENVNADNIAETCSFGQDPSVSNEDFTVDVVVGDEILWEGISSTNPDGDVVEMHT